MHFQFRFYAILWGEYNKGEKISKTKKGDLDDNLGGPYRNSCAFFRRAILKYLNLLAAQVSSQSDLLTDIL